MNSTNSQDVGISQRYVPNVKHMCSTNLLCISAKSIHVR